MAQNESTGVNIKQQGNFEGTCTSFLFCFFDSSSAKTHQQSILVKKDKSRQSISNQSEVDRNLDEELLDDLELVLEGRGLISTIFLPSKHTAEGTSSSMPRTTFIRCRKGDNKIECQVVVDNNVVSNGTLKRFKFSVFDVTRVSVGRDKNSLIPAVVDDNFIMRFTIVGKGELHFVFESQHVRDDIVQGFKLLIAKKKKAMISKPMSPKNEKDTENASVVTMQTQDSTYPIIRSRRPSESEISQMDGDRPDEKSLIQQSVR